MREEGADLVFAKMQKVKEREGDELYPELNGSEDILLPVDGALRSHYARLGANLRRGRPNASRIGYTGTPKQDRGVFSEYIDKYSMRQSNADKVTMEGMDTAFADVFSEYNLAERLQILGYGSHGNIVKAQIASMDKAKRWLKEHGQLLEQTIQYLRWTGSTTGGVKVHANAHQLVSN